MVLKDFTLLGLGNLAQQRRVSEVPWAGPQKPNCDVKHGHGAASRSPQPRLVQELLLVPAALGSSLQNCL